MTIQASPGKAERVRIAGGHSATERQRCQAVSGRRPAEHAVVQRAPSPAMPGLMRPAPEGAAFSRASRRRHNHVVGPLRVVVVDDHPVFAEALRERLSAEPDIDVVATAADSRSALSAVATLQPDVVTLDIPLGEEDGLAVGGHLLGVAPRLSLVAVTCVDDPRVAVQAVWTGVRAWVAKDMGMDFLLAAIRGAAHGHSWFAPAMLGRMLPLLAGKGTVNRYGERLAALTDRELQILEHLVDGLGRRAIADRLCLSVNTVRTHVQSVLTKLQVHSTLEAVALALAAGLRGEQADDADGIPPLV